MKMKIVEVSCDWCTGAIGHYHPGHVDKMIRGDGGIVTRKGQHFCQADCRDAWRAWPSNLNNSRLNED